MAVDTRLRRLAAFPVAAGLVAIVGLIFHGVLFGRGDHKLGILVSSNVMTGIIAGALYLQTRVREWEKQQLLNERLQKIADMNHHVRNALVVVQFYGTQRGDRFATEAVAEAVKRIEWTLREVLPRGWNITMTLAQNQALKKSRAAAGARVN